MSGKSTSSRRRSRNSTNTIDAPPPAVLSEAYLETHTSKNDLVRRLRKVVVALSDEELEVNSPEHPGLASLVSTLVNPRYLRHKDKEVRLHTVLACMEAFYLYAPEAPWDTNEIIGVFEQILQQLGNLSHCTVPSMPNYTNYFRLLDQLATVKVAVVLVELYNQGVSEALETLTEFIRTLMEAMHREHPREVMANAVVAITACIEEYEPSNHNIPIAILDELLDVVAAGPTTTEIIAPSSHTTSSSNEGSVKQSKRSKPPAQDLPQTVQVPSPAFVLAKHVLQRCEDRLSSPIARLLNALLNTHGTDSARSGSNSAILQSTRLHTDQVYLIIYELHKVCPNILTEVIGNVAGLLQCEDSPQRLRVTRLLGRLFYSQQSAMLEKFEACFREWIRRASDVDTDIRLVMAKCLVQLVRIGKCQATKMNTSGCIEHSLMTLLTDKELAIRQHVLNTLCNIALDHPKYLTVNLMRQLGERVQSRNKHERREAVTGLAKVYARHYILPRIMSLQHCLSGDEDDNGTEKEEDEALSEELCTRLSKLLNSQNNKSDEHEDLLGWIPETILHCLQYYTDEIDWEMRSRIIHLLDEVLIPKSAVSSSRQRAVAVCLLYHAVPLNCVMVLSQLLSQRVIVQEKLAEYVRLRTEAAAGSTSAEERQLTLHLAKGVLLNLPHIPYSLSETDTSNNALTRLHTHRDRHLLRLLHTVCTPLHTPNALQRAFADIPSRLNASDAEAQWIKHAFLRRVGMGHIYTHPTWYSCATLALQCIKCEKYGVEEGGALVFIQVLDWLTKNVSGELIGKRGFQVLVQMFALVHHGYAKTNSQSQKPVKKGRGRGSNARVQREADLHVLLHLTAAILSRVAPTFKNSEDGKDNFGISEDDQIAMKDTLTELCLNGTDSALAQHAIRILHTLQPVRKDSNGMQDFLAKLCTPRRLALPQANQSSSHILVYLASLTSLAECGIMHTRALNFGLKVLLRSENEECLNQEILCSVIDLVVSYMRCQVQLTKATKKSVEKSSNAPDISQKQVAAVYAKISSILTPLDSIDAEMRTESPSLVQRAAGKALLRLSDSAMPLAWHKLLTPVRYAKLAILLLQQSNTGEDTFALWQELQSMLLVQQPYYSLAPKLQFLALSVMCNVNTSFTNSANGIRGASRHCILQLRKTVEAVMSQCQSSGEEIFERKFKPALMPEYALPYAVYLLSITSRTSVLSMPSNDTKVDVDVHGSENGNNISKILVKRWKALLEPLVQTLGEEAENVGFLSSVLLEIEHEYSIRSDNFQIEDDDEEDVLAISNISDQQLKLVCRTGRAVLQKYVKKDVNLSAHSKQMVLLPKEYFVRKGSVQQQVQTTKAPASRGRVSFGRTTTVSVDKKADSHVANEFPFTDNHDLDGMHGDDGAEFGVSAQDEFAITPDDDNNTSSEQPQQQLEATQDSTTHTNFTASTPAGTSTPLSRRSSVGHTPQSEISELTAPPSTSRTKVQNEIVDTAVVEKKKRKTKTVSKTKIAVNRSSIGSSRSGTLSAVTGSSSASSSTGTRRSGRKRSSISKNSNSITSSASKKRKSSPLDDFDFSDDHIDEYSDDEGVGNKKRMKGKKKSSGAAVALKKIPSTSKNRKPHLQKLDINVPDKPGKSATKTKKATITSTNRKARTKTIR